jgi:hypothetical protein
MWAIFFALGLAQSQNGSISGTLREKTSELRAGVRVAAVAVSEIGAPQGTATVLVSITETDKEGRFRLENIPPGRYYIVSGIVEAPTYVWSSLHLLPS